MPAKITVMTGLDPVIHAAGQILFSTAEIRTLCRPGFVLTRLGGGTAWMAGSSPAMTAGVFV